MREAADILNSEAAMQIRYLETLSSMAKQTNTKVVFLPHGDAKLDMKSAQVLEHIGGA
jgi:erythrocyte band 7 integral membrane protein